MWENSTSERWETFHVHCHKGTSTQTYVLDIWAKSISDAYQQARDDGYIPFACS